jgi:hypothetical protein
MCKMEYNLKDRNMGNPGQKNKSFCDLISVATGHRPVRIDFANDYK